MLNLDPGCLFVQCIVSLSMSSSIIVTSPITCQCMYSLRISVSFGFVFSKCSTLSSHGLINLSGQLVLHVSVFTGTFSLAGSVMHVLMDVPVLTRTSSPIRAKRGPLVSFRIPSPIGGENAHVC